MEPNNKKRISIVGGGLVGALNACYFAKRGFNVDLYELREDIRRQQVVRGRSINLALSHRGREALRAIGLEDTVVQSGIPMYSRMIHNLDGTRHPIPYGTKQQYIMSIDRRRLNELLLSGAEEYANVQMHFHHKLSSCNFMSGECTYTDQCGHEVHTTHDLVVGCDGAFSKVRGEIMKHTRMNCSQEYIPHGYIELSIPPTADGKFAMEKNFLHIWPRKTFMLIGLPNTEDNSFVLTLFMPFAMFDIIKTKQDVINFFDETFPDAVPLIGREALMTTFFERAALPLISIKCSPYNVLDKAVIMGDAAHAMVPFYGQGMNCGFEDCLVFDDLLTKYHNDFSQTLEEFSRTRNPDAEAICDLALYNYVEMRDSVNSKLFLLRKKVDNLLYWLFPRTWIPLYTSVSFTRLPYRQCIQNKQWQDKLLKRMLSIAGLSLVIGGSFTAWSLAKDNTNNFLKDAFNGKQLHFLIDSVKGLKF